MRRPRSAPLFPYTTLFRSAVTLNCRSVCALAKGGPMASDTDRNTAARRKVRPEERECIMGPPEFVGGRPRDRKSTRLNSSHSQISYAVFCLKKKRQFSQVV